MSKPKRDELEELSKNFRELADLIDQAIKLSEREELGEDIEKESEDIMGKIMVKLMKINNVF